MEQIAKFSGTVSLNQQYQVIGCSEYTQGSHMIYNLDLLVMEVLFIYDSLFGSLGAYSLWSLHHLTVTKWPRLYTKQSEWKCKDLKIWCLVQYLGFPDLRAITVKGQHNSCFSHVRHNPVIYLEFLCAGAPVQSNMLEQVCLRTGCHEISGFVNILFVFVLQCVKF